MERSLLCGHMPSLWAKVSTLPFQPVCRSPAMDPTTQPWAAVAHPLFGRLTSRGETTHLESTHRIHVCQKRLCVVLDLLHLWGC